MANEQFREFCRVLHYDFHDHLGSLMYISCFLEILSMVFLLCFVTTRLETEGTFPWEAVGDLHKCVTVVSCGGL